MKKITAFFLTVLIFVMSMFSINAFAQGTDTETESFDVSQTRLAKWNEKMNGTKEVDCLITMIQDDGTSKVTRLCRKGDNVLVETTMNGTEIRMIENSKGQFMYFPNIPILYFKFDKYVEDSFLFTYGIPENLVYVKAYEESGYYVEEFYDTKTDVTCRYYFVGDDLKLEKGGDNSTKEYISYEVNENDVKLPSFCIDATLLLPLFLIFML